METQREKNKIKERVRKSLEAQRQQLLIRQPFIGSIMMQQELVPVFDSRVPTSCTDGKHIFVSCRHYEKLTSAERCFVLAHEVWHTALMHAQRQQNRDRKYFDTAADLEIHFLLQEENFTEPFIPPHDPAWQGLSAEEIYERLRELDGKTNTLIGGKQSENIKGIRPDGGMDTHISDWDVARGKKANDDDELFPSGDIPMDNGGQLVNVAEIGLGTKKKKKKKKRKTKEEDDEGMVGGAMPGGDRDGECQDGESKAGEPKAGEGAADDQDTSGERSEKTRADGSHCSDGQGNQGKEGKDAKDGADGEEGADGEDENERDPDFQPVPPSSITDDMRYQIIQAAQRAERRHGRIPGGMERLLRRIRKPRLRWQELLKQYVSSIYGGERHWLPPARRYIGSGLYLPSRRDKRLQIVVALDTSGSTQDYIPEFLGELNRILKSFGNYDLTLIQCDSTIQKVDRYNEARPLRDVKDLVVMGGGGTDFKPVFGYISKAIHDVKLLLFLTDGYGDAPEKKPRYPVMWVLTPDGEAPRDWGRKLQLRD